MRAADNIDAAGCEVSLCTVKGKQLEKQSIRNRRQHLQHGNKNNMEACGDVGKQSEIRKLRFCLLGMSDVAAYRGMQGDVGCRSIQGHA